ncbi:Tim44 domain-containing protein [Pelomonas sp. V22]|nr:Tim44 domain-containing protein [Pelomonas sp. V22]
MKRTVPQQTTPAQPAKPAAPTQNAAQPAPAAPAPAAAPVQPPKRSWMGPLAGLAAGLGLAALASHFGFGAAMANIMTMVLIGLVAMLVIGFLVRRFGAAKQAQPAYAGGNLGGQGGGYAPVQRIDPQPLSASAAPAAAAAPVAASAEDAEFAQLAKKVFIRLQAANDAGDQADLRRFTTPEMYASIQQELLDRKGATQQTEVLQLDATVIDRAEEHGQQVVSVRFWGLVRERSEDAASGFDEVWHLARPLDGSREWAIAGIQASQ